MPIYLYKGFDAQSGAIKKGKIEAESEKAARAKLRAKERIIPSELKEEVALSKKSSGSAFMLSSKVSMEDLAIMTRQFATLQKAQVPLDDCLKALTEQVENVLLRNTLSAVKDSVSEGLSLADALGKYPNIFNKLYVNMVKAGETSGNLGLILERLADFIEYQVAVKGQVVGAMVYPAIMILASIGIIAFLFISIVPKLQKVFESLRVALPWYTKTLITVSEILQKQWYLILMAVALAYFMFKSWYATEKGRLIVDRLLLKAPILGAVVIRLNVSKFTKTLSTLLSSGVPIIAALEITKNIIANRIISDVIVNAKQAVQEGDSLGVVIERSGEFPPLVSHMIKTGEKTGELEQMLKHVAEAYDAEVERKIETLISLIEPLMILFMGGIVVVVVIAMLMPMMSIMSQVR